METTKLLGDMKTRAANIIENIANIKQIEQFVSRFEDPSVRANFWKGYCSGELTLIVQEQWA